MTKWIQELTAALIYDPYPGEIFLREVHSTHSESHNAVNGNPTFRVRLECPWTLRKNAISRLLGGPEIWPKDTVLKQMYAVSAEVVSDGGSAQTDVDKQILNYDHNALIDVTYAQRPGTYHFDYNEEYVYVYDELTHRNEAFPVDHTKLVWGLTTDTPPVSPPTPPQLTPYEAPVEYLPGYTFTRTIEGWSMDIPKTDDLPGQPNTGLPGPIAGTTNQHACKSLNLRRTFKPGTLLFRTMIASSATSFRSYHFPVPDPDEGDNEPAVTPPKHDLSGKPTMTLKLVYEYREEGWDRFRRVNLVGTTTGWYYIRYNEGNYSTKYEPFPRTDHRIFLGDGS